MDTNFLRKNWQWGAAIAGFFVARELWQRRKSIHLRGKVVVISGGSRGLGLAIAEAFAREGSRLALCSRDEEELALAKQQMLALGAEVVTFPCDVSNMDEVNDVIERVLQHFGRIDVLVNNAGIISTGNWQAMTRDDFELAMNTMFWGMYNMTMAVIPQMQERKDGRIVNITSIGGKVSIPRLLPYSSAKFAAVGFSEGLHSELAKDGIIVTTVAPGLLRTGSAINTVARGESYREEYALFKLLDTLPLTSISAQRAAQQIVQATRRGSTELVITIQAQILTLLHGVLPGTTIDLLSLVNRFLPGGEDRTPSKHMGSESESPLSQSPLTALGKRAEQHYNERPTSEKSLNDTSA